MEGRHRRVFILLRREGERSGINRIYRLYREEGLAVRRRRSRRRAVGTRAPILVQARPSSPVGFENCLRNLTNIGKLRIHHLRAPGFGNLAQEHVCFRRRNSVIVF